MVKNYIIIALRNLWKSKTISFINIFGLAVSMSVCLMLILLVSDQLSYDSYHSKKDQIYRVITDRIQQDGEVWSTASTAFPLADVLKQHESLEESTVLKKNFSGVAKWQDQELPFEGLYTDNTFLKIFDFPLAKGDPKTALSLPNSIILKKELAENIFGDTNPINEVIEVEGQGDLVVTGVFDDLPGKTHIFFDALTTIDFLSARAKQDSSIYTGFEDWNFIYDSYIYFQVKEGKGPEDLVATLKTASKDHYDAQGNFSYKFLLQPLTEITPGPSLSNTLGFGLPKFVIFTMLGIALIVLLSACFNYANLTTARAINRAKEIGVRKTIGARNKHIFSQFMIEAVIIALISFIFADLMLQIIHPRMNNFLTSLGAPVTFDETSNLYLYFLGFAVFAGISAGLVPAFFFSRTNPLLALKKSLQVNALTKKLGFSRFDFRKVLVVIQFAFSIFFVITVITLYQQSQFVLTTDHGFKTEGVMNIRLQGLEYSKLKSSLQSLSSVKAVSSATHMPALGSNTTANAKLPGSEDEIALSYIGVDQNYISSMELSLLHGRNFPEAIPETEQFIIINETACKRFGWSVPTEAVGERIEIGNIELEVIGVIEDIHYERLDEAIGPMALRYLPNYASNAIVIFEESRQKEVIADVDKVWKELTNRPFDYTFYKDDLRISYVHFEALMVMLSYITILVISISSLGLLGMVIYHVQNKTKEIGIRKTLGAEVKDVLFLVGKGFLILITIAYAIGGPIAYFVNDMWLQTNVYRIDFGWPTLLTGFLFILAIVSLTVGSQAYRALNINPVESLKSE
ncbi:MAG: FtsX-like permease family protein [Bacteroidota bacterium]